jgi:hypothetical protein
MADCLEDYDESNIDWSRDNWCGGFVGGGGIYGRSTTNSARNRSSE